MTHRCLECHPNAAEVMKTSHFQWLGEEVEVLGHAGKTRIGKKNLINNFCIATTGNEQSCTKCHAGYGWVDDTFDFKKPENVDCLVCHERTSGLREGDGRHPHQGDRPGGRGPLGRHAAPGELPRLPRLRRRRPGA